MIMDGRGHFFYTFLVKKIIVLKPKIEINQPIFC